MLKGTSINISSDRLAAFSCRLHSQLLIHVCCVWLISNGGMTPTFHLWRLKVPRHLCHWFDAGQAGGNAQHGKPWARSRYLSFTFLLALSFAPPLPPAILLVREVLWSSCARSQASGCIVSPSITIHLTAILSALPKTQLSAVPSTTAGGPRKVSLSLLSLVELE